MKNAPTKKHRHELVNVGDLIKLTSKILNKNSIRGECGSLGLVIAVRRWQIDFAFDASTRGTVEVLWSTGACETLIEGDWAEIVRKGDRE